MKLSRIRVEQFRQFLHPLEIAGLAPGINVFSGPNEAGKSTLVTAIRAAFFERHRSGTVDDLRPWSDSAAAPSVELDFEHDGRAYRLSKRFLGRKRCELVVDGVRFEGAEAEDELARLFGFEHAGRGGSKAEHWGIPGLLWIQQGAAHELREPLGHATQHLRGALDASLGELASSGGDELIAEVEQARNVLLTAATGRPRGDYQAAIERERTLEQAQAELRQEIVGYRRQVDTLAALRAEHERDATTRPWESYRAREREALARLAEIRVLEEQLGTQRQRVVQLDQRAELLRAQLDGFSAQQRAVESRTAHAVAARTALEAARARVVEWRDRHAAQATAAEHARLRLQQARRLERRRALEREARELRQAIEQASASLQAAEAEEARLLELRRQAVEHRIADADLKQLRALQTELEALRIRQDAAATRLHYRLEAGRQLVIEGEALGGEGERRVHERTRVQLPGLGVLEIAPGGSGLAELRRTEADVRERLEESLRGLGVQSLEAAEVRASAQLRIHAEIRTAEATLKALAKKGVDALRETLAAAHARADECARALTALAASEAGGSAEGRDEAAGGDVADADEGAAAAASLSVSEAESAEQTAARSAEAARAQLHEAELAAGAAQSALTAAERELSAATEVLADPEREVRLSRTNHELTDALAERASAAERVERLAQQVTEARPEILEQDAQRLGTSARQLEQQFNERRDAVMRLEVELRTTGARELDERLAETERDLESARRRVSELRRRAEALDYLLGLLRDKRAALTRRLQAPLRAHLDRYLPLLFPQSRMEIDEQLAPGAITREHNGGTETSSFDALSFGAREQMGVVVRLAYADLLREAGRPTLIILDDALVHSDETRLERMKRILFDAATRHQILLLTCHPERWRDLGTAARSLEMLRAATA